MSTEDKETKPKILTPRDGYLVSAKYASIVLGQTTQAFHQSGYRAIEGSCVDPRTKNGYDIAEVVQKKLNYFKHENEKLRSKAAQTLEAGLDPKDQYYTERAKAERIKNAKSMGTVLDTKRTEEVVLSLIANLKLRLLQAPSRLSGAVYGAQSKKEANHILSEEIESILEDLASFDIKDCLGDDMLDPSYDLDADIEEEIDIDKELESGKKKP